MIGWLMKSELCRIWKEAIVEYFSVGDVFTEWTKESTTTCQDVSGPRFEPATFRIWSTSADQSAVTAVFAPLTILCVQGSSVI
jgi:hypothetical protein